MNQHGATSARHVYIEEKLAIFLYTCVTGLSLRRVSERFQRANETTSKLVLFHHAGDSGPEQLLTHRYFVKMLIFFSSPPFYTQYIHLPPIDTPTPSIILNNPKYYPFFKDVLGAIDGTHINCSAYAEMRQAARDRKGGVTQNCLAICGFDMIFYYIFSGWDGSAADSTMFYDARMTDLHIPAGKYYLVDAGFPSVMHSLFLNVGCVITLQNGAGNNNGANFLFNVIVLSDIGLQAD